MNKSLILALTALVPFASADEVKLKDGTVHKNCTVDVETAETVTILVPVEGGIKDSLTLKRELIESITKASPDELEAAKINKNYGKVDAMSLPELEKSIEELDRVIKKNPQGLTHDAAVKAKARVTVLLEEKKLVAASKEAEAAKEEEAVTVRTKYDYESGKLLKRFKALVAAGKPYQSMVVYDRMKTNYPGSAALVDAYPDAVRISAQLDRKLNVLIAAKEKALEKERLRLSKEEETRRADTRLTQEQRSVLLDGYQKKQQALRERENQLTEVHRAHRKKVNERGDRWFEPTAGSVDAMRDLKLVSAVDAERLKEQEPENGAGSAALAKAWTLCDEKKFDQAEQMLTEIRNARVPSEYYEELTETVRTGYREQRTREREERAAAAKKKRDDRDKEAKAKREGKKK